ncbi:toxin-activating lysine-acyltransferase [Telmatospirillum sp.]|uniref:toxin-activating lysine-acyltransferase n=1 Tax=Telmatospirillum sp. TaxID=2079197 RepID=UPI00283EABCC|nr:toxin-activating lysine-acyltransferase [Telmatospirillum sp.]MDR3439785.1 toxin-activating lysine-acyltransferase [Telmatospirillum sp.]
MTKQTEPAAKPADITTTEAAPPPAPVLSLTDRDLLYVLGEVSWLMSRSPRHRYVFMADLEWQVMPAIVLKQARIYRKPPPSAQPDQPPPADQPGTPIAFVTWAVVSDAVDERLKAGVGRLQPPEWRSGPHPWIVDVVAPFGGAEQAVAQVVKDVFGGKEVPVVGMARKATGDAVMAASHD